MTRERDPGAFGRAGERGPSSQVCHVPARQATGCRSLYNSSYPRTSKMPKVPWQEWQVYSNIRTSSQHMAAE